MATASHNTSQLESDSSDPEEHSLVTRRAVSGCMVSRMDRNIRNKSISVIFQDVAWTSDSGARTDLAADFDESGNITFRYVVEGTNPTGPRDRAIDHALQVAKGTRLSEDEKSEAKTCLKPFIAMFQNAISSVDAVCPSFPDALSAQRLLQDPGHSSQSSDSRSRLSFTSPTHDCKVSRIDRNIENNSGSVVFQDGGWTSEFGPRTDLAADFDESGNIKFRLIVDDTDPTGSRETEIDHAMQVAKGARLSNTQANEAKTCLRPFITNFQSMISSVDASCPKFPDALSSSAEKQLQGPDPGSHSSRSRSTVKITLRIDATSREVIELSFPYEDDEESEGSAFPVQSIEESSDDAQERSDDDHLEMESDCIANVKTTAVVGTATKESEGPLPDATSHVGSPETFELSPQSSSSATVSQDTRY